MGYEDLTKWSFTPKPETFYVKYLPNLYLS